MHQELKLHLQTTCPFKNQMHQMSRHSTILLSLQNKTFITFNNNHDHLEQVRRFILKHGFQEPIIISCDLTTGKAYITEGNHRLWVAIQDSIPFIPCRVVPHWLPPNGPYKELEIDFSTLKFEETILPETTGIDCCTDWFQ